MHIFSSVAMVIPRYPYRFVFRRDWNGSFISGSKLSPVPVSTQVLPGPAGVYDFQLPNWKDNMPIKYMRVQLSWENAPPAPVNVFSQAIFANNTILGNITFASTPIANAAGTGWYQYFDLTFQPNPEWERVHVTLPAGGLLTQAVIDTVSTVPEPATIAILALGSLALRRTRKASAL
jgi:hypothetical protein